MRRSKTPGRHLLLYNHLSSSRIRLRFYGQSHFYSPKCPRLPIIQPAQPVPTVQVAHAVHHRLFLAALPRHQEHQKPEAAYQGTLVAGTGTAEALLQEALRLAALDAVAAAYLAVAFRGSQRPRAVGRGMEVHQALQDHRVRRGTGVVAAEVLLGVVWAGHRRARGLLVAGPRLGLRPLQVVGRGGRLVVVGGLRARQALS